MDNKTKLLGIVEELNLDINLQEFATDLDKLSEDELQVLVDKYQLILDTRNTTWNYYQKNNPQEATTVDSDYQEKMNKAEDDYLYKLEKIQEQKDLEADAAEASHAAEIEEVEKEVDELIENADKAQRKLSEAIFNNK